MFGHRLPGNGKMKFTALLLLLCLFSGGAIAQASECQSIQKAAARLACYDRASPPTMGAKPAESKTPVVQSPPGQFVDQLAAENNRLDEKLKTICRGC